MVAWNKKFNLVNGGTTMDVMMMIIVATMVLWVFVVNILFVVRNVLQIGVHIWTLLKKNLNYLMMRTIMITTMITTALSMTLG